MSDIRRASVKELAYKIKAYKTPRFAFLLGAGASRQSGIPVASEMIRHFKEQIIVQNCPDELKTEQERNDWLTGQDWYRKAGSSEYCKCFEKFEPKEYGRQRYIENMIEGREPSFGYVVLANLMASNHINTIVTTNFDDLVYSACTTFTGIRPIVYAYGVLASEMRFTARRTKILKLHGDYLYSTIKNTRNELARQDPNMARQLRVVLGEYGLIVVGYGGGDSSVMKILSDISERNDLYWCIRRGEEPNEAVKKLLRDKGGFLVEIEGFDEMMNEIRPIVEFDVRKMIGSIEERRNQIIRHLEKFAPQYSVEILGKIVDAAKEPTTKINEDKKIDALDFVVNAYKAQQAKDFDKAAELYRKAIELDPNYAAAYNNLGTALSDLKRYDEAEVAYRKAIELDPNDALTYNNLGAALNDLKRYDEAEAILRKALELDPNDALAYTNLGAALRELKRVDEAETILRKALELDPNDALAYNNLGAALNDLKRYDEAEAILRKALELNPSNALAYNNLGAALSDLKRYDEAEVAFCKAIELDPNYASPYYNLACLESIRNNTDAAIEHLRRAAQQPDFNLELARRDPDFEWIRDDARFREIVGEDT